ncbi:MAG: hypothetical protein ACRDL5_12770 [Solirubrobacteraceae bacterium]
MSGTGSIVVSTTPLAPASWTSAVIDPGSELAALSCPSSTLCVAVDRAGDVLTSLRPTGGAGSWTSAPVDAASGLVDLSCPSVQLCVAVGGGDVAFSTNPAAGGRSWQLASGVPWGRGRPRVREVRRQLWLLPDRVAERLMPNNELLRG